MTLYVGKMFETAHPTTILQKRDNLHLLNKSSVNSKKLEEALVMCSLLKLHTEEVKISVCL